MEQKDKELLLNEGWISVSENPPDNFKDVYLYCRYMNDFITVGQIANGQRIKSTTDPDIFFRSAVLLWKPLTKE